jgi:Tfp pilus assembly protein PilO
MSEKSSGIMGYWQKLTKRERVIAGLAVVCILSWLLYQYPFTMQERAIKSMKAGIGASELEILDLTAQIADLKTRKTESKGVSAGWELADQKSVILFLEDVSGEARRLGVNLVAVHPTQEIDKEKYKEVSLNLDLKGRYRELAEYFKRLESLSKVVNVRKIRLESCPDSSSVCAAHVEAVTYMAK